MLRRANLRTVSTATGVAMRGSFVPPAFERFDRAEGR